MRLSRVLIAGAAVAAAGIATSAFTAGNTVEEDTIAGYGSAEVSGVEVSNIKYTQDADPSKLAEVEFTVDRNTADSIATLTLYKLDDDGAGPNTETTLSDASTCTSSVALVAPFTITCSFGLTPVSLQAFDKVGLTVVSQ